VLALRRKHVMPDAAPANSSVQQLASSQNTLQFAHPIRPLSPAMTMDRSEWVSARLMGPPGLPVMGPPRRVAPVVLGLLIGPPPRPRGDPAALKAPAETQHRDRVGR
jgi:hypothetical protein